MTLLVRCINDAYSEGALKEGTIYEVCRADNGFYVLANVPGPSGMDGWLMDRFEVVDKFAPCPCGISRLDCEYHR